MDLPHYKEDAYFQEPVSFRPEKAHKFHKRQKVLNQIDISSILCLKQARFVDHVAASGPNFSHLRWNVEMLSAQVGTSAVVGEWLNTMEPLLISLPMIIHNKKKVIRSISIAMQSDNQDLISMALECISALCTDLGLSTLGKSLFFRLLESVIKVLCNGASLTSKSLQTKSATVHEVNYLLEKCLQTLVTLIRFFLKGSKDAVTLKKIATSLRGLFNGSDLLPVKAIAIVLCFEMMPQLSTSFFDEKSPPSSNNDDVILVGSLVLLATLFPELSFSGKLAAFHPYDGHDVRMPHTIALRALSLLFHWFLDLSSIPQSQYRIIQALFPDKREVVDISRLTTYLKNLFSQLQLDDGEGDLHVLDDALRILIPLFSITLDFSEEFRKPILDALICALQLHQRYLFDPAIAELLGRSFSKNFPLQQVLPFLPSPSFTGHYFWKQVFASMSSSSMTNELLPSSSSLVEILSSYLSQEVQQGADLIWAKIVITGKDKPIFSSALKAFLASETGGTEAIVAKICDPHTTEEQRYILVSLLKSTDSALLSVEKHLSFHASQIVELLKEAHSIQLLALASHFVQFQSLAIPMLIGVLHCRTEPPSIKDEDILVLLDAFSRYIAIQKNLLLIKEDSNVLSIFCRLVRSKNDEIRMLAIRIAGQMLELPRSLMENLSLPVTLTTCRQRLLDMERIVEMGQQAPQILLNMLIGLLVWTPFRPFQEGLFPLWRKVLLLLSPELAWQTWVLSFQEACIDIQKTPHISIKRTRKDLDCCVLPLELLLNLLMTERCMHHLMNVRGSDGPIAMFSDLFVAYWRSDPTFMFSAGLATGLPSFIIRPLCIPILKVLIFLQDINEGLPINAELDDLTRIVVNKTLSSPDALLQKNSLEFLMKRHSPLLATLRELNDVFALGVREVDWNDLLPRLADNYQTMKDQKTLFAQTLISFIFGRISMSSRLSSSLQAINRRKIIAAMVAHLPPNPFWPLLFERASITMACLLEEPNKKNPSASFPKGSHIIGFYNLVEEFLSQASHAIPSQLIYEIGIILLGIIRFKQAHELESDHIVSDDLEEGVLEEFNAIPSNTTIEQTIASKNREGDSVFLDSAEKHGSKDNEEDPFHENVALPHSKSRSKNGLISRAVTLLSRILKFDGREHVLTASPPFIQWMLTVVNEVDHSNTGFFGIEIVSSLIPYEFSQSWLKARLPHLTSASDAQVMAIFTQLVIPLLSQKHFPSQEVATENRLIPERLLTNLGAQSNFTNNKDFQPVNDLLLDEILNTVTLLLAARRRGLFKILFKAAALLPSSLMRMRENFSFQVISLFTTEFSSLSEVKMVKLLIAAKNPKREQESWIPLALSVLDPWFLSKVILTIPHATGPSESCTDAFLPSVGGITSKPLSTRSKIAMLALLVSQGVTEVIPLELKQCWCFADAIMLSESLSKIADVASDLFLCRPIISQLEEIALRAIAHWIKGNATNLQDDEPTINPITEEESILMQEGGQHMGNDVPRLKNCTPNLSDAVPIICNILFSWLQLTLVRKEFRHYVALRSDLLCFLSTLLDAIPPSLAIRLSPISKALWHFVNPNYSSEKCSSNSIMDPLVLQSTAPLSKTMLAALGEVQFPVRQKAFERLQKHLQRSLDVKKEANLYDHPPYTLLIEEWIWPLAGIALIPEARKRSGLSAYSSVQETALNLWITCAISMSLQQRSNTGTGKPCRLPQEILLAFIAMLSSPKKNSSTTKSSSAWWWLPPTEAFTSTPRLAERLLVAFLEALCLAIADFTNDNGIKQIAEVGHLAPLVMERIIPLAMGSPSSLRPKLASFSLRFLALAGEPLSEGLLGSTLISGLKNRELTHRDQCRHILREALIAWPLSISLPLVTKLIHRIVTPGSAERFAKEFDANNAHLYRQNYNDEHGGFLKHVTSYTIAELLEHVVTTEPTRPMPVSNIDSQTIARLVYIFVEASTGTLAREKTTEQWINKALEVRQQRASRALAALSRLLPLEQVCNELLPMLYKLFSSRHKHEGEFPSKASAILGRIGGVLRTHPSLMKAKSFQEGAGSLVLVLVQHAYTALFRLLPPNMKMPVDKTPIDLLIGRFGLSLFSSLADDVLPLMLPRNFLNSASTTVNMDVSPSPEEITPHLYTFDVLGPALLSLIINGDIDGTISLGDVIVAESMRLLARLYARWRHHCSDSGVKVEARDKLMAQAVSRAVKLIVKERPEDISSTALISATFAMLTGAVGDRKLLSDGHLRSIISSPRFTDRELFSRMLQSEVCAAGVGPFLRRFYACRRLAIAEAYDLAELLLENLLHASNDGIRVAARDALVSFLSSYPFSEGRFASWLQRLVSQMDHSWEESRMAIFELLGLVFSKDIAGEDASEKMMAIKETILLKSLLLHLQDAATAVRISADRLILLLLSSDSAAIMYLLEWCRSWLAPDQPSTFHKIGAVGVIKCHQAMPSFVSSKKDGKMLEEISLLLKKIISSDLLEGV